MDVISSLSPQLPLHPAFAVNRPQNKILHLLHFYIYHMFPLEDVSFETSLQ